MEIHIRNISYIFLLIICKTLLVVRQTSVGNDLSTVDPTLGQKDGIDDLLKPHYLPLFLKGMTLQGSDTTGGR